MAISSYPPVPATKKNIVTLTSGTSWTVPTGVTSIIATLVGGGGGGGSVNTVSGNDARPGQLIRTTVATTPGASITYAIGAGGVAESSGGTTSFTGATSAVGGTRGAGQNPAGIGTLGLSVNNAGGAGVTGNGTGSAGGAGLIEIEYWV